MRVGHILRISGLDIFEKDIDGSFVNFNTHMIPIALDHVVIQLCGLLM